MVLIAQKLDLEAFIELHPRRDSQRDSAVGLRASPVLEPQPKIRKPPFRVEPTVSFRHANGMSDE
jgi:hypothetical protein